MALLRVVAAGSIGPFMSACADREGTAELPLDRTFPGALEAQVTDRLKCE